MVHHVIWFMFWRKIEEYLLPILLNSKSYYLIYKLQDIFVDMCHSSHDQHTHPWRRIFSHVKNKWHLKFQEYLASYDIICVYIMYHEAPRGYGFLQLELGCFKVYAFYGYCNWSLQMCKCDILLKACEHSFE